MAHDPGGRISEVRGRVDRRVVGRGTKSERETVVLDTGVEILVLRARRGPSFGATGYEQFVGQIVVCTGTIVGHVLLVDHIRD